MDSGRISFFRLVCITCCLSGCTRSADFLPYDIKQNGTRIRELEEQITNNMQILLYIGATENTDLDRANIALKCCLSIIGLPDKHECALAENMNKHDMLHLTKDTTKLVSKRSKLLSTNQSKFARMTDDYNRYASSHHILSTLRNICLISSIVAFIIGLLFFKRR